MDDRGCRRGRLATTAALLLIAAAIVAAGRLWHAADARAAAEDREAAEWRAILRAVAPEAEAIRAGVDEVAGVDADEDEAGPAALSRPGRRPATSGRASRDACSKKYLPPPDHRP